MSALHEQFEKKRELLNREFVIVNGGISSIVKKVGSVSFIAFTTRKLSQEKIEEIKERSKPYPIEFRRKAELS